MGEHPVLTINLFCNAVPNYWVPASFRFSSAGFHPGQKVDFVINYGGLLAILGPRCLRSLGQIVGCRGPQKLEFLPKTDPKRDIGGTGPFKDFLKKMKKTLVRAAILH